MKFRALLFVSSVFTLFALNALAVTRYVDLNSPSPTPPYLDWTTAATNIQDAIDAAANGDLVLVSNGVYQAGGRIVHGDLTNRVAVTKPITVQSVNGLMATVIQGYQVPGVTNYSTAVRCVYLTNGALLVGFTLTNGATSASGGGTSPQLRGGGAFCESTNAYIRDCLIVGNVAYYSGGGVVNGTLTNCEMRGNLARVAAAGSSIDGGGGAFQSVMYNCVISSNVIQQGFGGGATDSSLIGCIIIGNRNLANLSTGGGGGARGGYLTNCLVIGNQIAAGGGGGLYGGFCINSLIASNSASSGGGGVSVLLEGCLVVRNAAANGGGVWSGNLINCTVVDNTAVSQGGGTYNSRLTNSIVYFNKANSTSNWFGGSANNCCLSPQISGSGNFGVAPQFVDQLGGDFRLQSNSLCINAGLNKYVTGNTDMDGNPRLAGGAVDMGAYEFQSPASQISYLWLLQYGLPADGSADFVDSDTDGMNNYGEWRSDTIPIDAVSVLRMVAATNSPTGTKVTWQSVATRDYWLERTTNLGVASPFQIVATNIVGTAGTKTYTDTKATNGGPYFYRVGVQ